MKRKSIIFWNKIFSSDECEMFPQNNGKQYITKHDEEKCDQEQFI